MDGVVHLVRFALLAHKSARIGRNTAPKLRGGRDGCEPCRDHAGADLLHKDDRAFGDRDAQLSLGDEDLARAEDASFFLATKRVEPAHSRGAGTLVYEAQLTFRGGDAVERLCVTDAVLEV